MSERLLRERDARSILVWEGGKEVTYEIAELYSRYGIDGIVRIREEEYAGIDPARGYLGHFNLETAGNVVGGKNALPRIVRTGFYDVRTGEEQLPLLSFEKIHFAVCERCDERLLYDELTPEFFRYSLGNIRDIETLQQVILSRYRSSLRGVSDEEILSRGVAFTLLKFYNGNNV